MCSSCVVDGSSCVVGGTMCVVWCSSSAQCGKTALWRDKWSKISKQNVKFPENKLWDLIEDYLRHVNSKKKFVKKISIIF